MEDHREESPINPLPPIVVILALVIVLIELALQAGAQGLVGGPDAIGWRSELARDYAVSGRVADWMVETGRYPWEHLIRFVTYPFIHISFMHAAMVVVFLTAMGKLVGETFGWIAVLIVFFGSALGGALAYWLVLHSPVALMGGYPAVYGLIGSYTFMLWLSLGSFGQSRLSAFQLIAVLLGIQLFFGLVFGGPMTWVADIAGFITGFGLSFLLVPGALGRIRDKMRHE